MITLPTARHEAMWPCNSSKKSGIKNVNYFPGRLHAAWTADTTHLSAGISVIELTDMSPRHLAREWAAPAIGSHARLAGSDENGNLVFMLATPGVHWACSPGEYLKSAHDPQLVEGCKRGRCADFMLGRQVQNRPNCCCRLDRLPVYALAFHHRLPG